MQKFISLKFHCRRLEKTKTSPKMKFKSTLIVLLAVFVIATLIVETECQGSQPGCRGNHLINKVCYYKKFSGIPSGSKSAKTLSRQWWCHFLSTCVISFLTNQLAVFSRAVKHLRLLVMWNICSTFEVRFRISVRPCNLCTWHISRIDRWSTIYRRVLASCTYPQIL